MNDTSGHRQAGPGAVVRRGRRRLRPGPAVVPARGRRVAHRPDPPPRSSSSAPAPASSPTGCSSSATTCWPPTPPTRCSATCGCATPTSGSRRRPRRRCRWRPAAWTPSSPPRPSTGSTPTAALREAARMLKPEGRIGLLWNQRDERIPWVRKLGAIIGNQDQDVDPTDVLVGSKLFGYVEDDDLPALAAAAQGRPARPRAVALERRGAGPDGAGPGAAQGRRALRGVRPRARRPAAALRHPLLPRRRPAARA